MKLEHTPGPWKVEETTDHKTMETYYDIYTEDDRPIACVYGDNAVWLAEGEDVKNARLIASAPEMLDSLFEGVNAMFARDTVLKSGMQALMVEVIEKATGKTWEQLQGDE